MAESSNFIHLMKRIFGVILVCSIIAEIVLFPSFANMAGCVMALISYLSFRVIVTTSNFYMYPFSIIIYFPLFLYRFLPLSATLLEGKPISYGMEKPIETFVCESMMIVVVSLAFRLSTLKLFSSRMIGFGVNILSKKLLVQEIWVMGFIGLLSYGLAIFIFYDSTNSSALRLLLINVGFLKNSPMIMLFPKLTKIQITFKHKFLVVLFYCVQFVISISSNSRNALIAPIISYSVLYFIDAGVAGRENVKTNLKSVTRWVFVLTFAFLIWNLLSDFSLAILYTRSSRSDVTRKELLVNTYKVFQDKKMLKELRMTGKLGKEEKGAYISGWTEDYLDNFLFNRFCNIRITDIGLYLDEKLDDASVRILRDEYVERIKSLYPSFASSLDKSCLLYSPGDRIYSLAIKMSNTEGKFIVVSDLAESFAVFGPFSFFVYLLLRWFVFVLANSLMVYKSRGEYSLSFFGLVLSDLLFSEQRNSSGSIGIVGFCLREFWIYLLIWVGVSKIILLFRTRRNLCSCDVEREIEVGGKEF